ncbi:hypothetical protein [Granulicella sibirica]|uniref:Cell surface protein n=1 Tax=Granulicella sibirica TaxID=2479048 RepID=A0A4Q0T6X3_9BACT|nr:hypothetical protein [Granulicella sibirica]RXH58420.1 Cell surface protein [Granulicella sibirica]
MTKRFLVLVCASLLSVDSSTARAVDRSPAAPSVSAVKGFGDIPLSFAANQGQADPDVSFLTSGSGYSVLLTGDGALMKLGHPANPKSSSSPRTQKPEEETTIRMQLLGSRPAEKVSGLDELPGKVNYLMGNDRANWHTGIPTFARVKYAGVYPGVDMVYYGNQKQLEFDFVLQPGSDPGKLGLRFSGDALGKGKRLNINAKGDLVISGSDEHVILKKPLLYQTGREKDLALRHPVEGGFVLSGDGDIRFQIGDYDRSKPLIIDPTLTYSTLIGSYAEGMLFAVDPAGNSYIAGGTYGPGLPITPGVVKPTCNYACPFVAKLNASGTAVVYVTYFGSPTAFGSDYFEGVAGDASGNVYLSGFTQSADFPTTPGAYQTTFSAPGVVFLSKLNATGSALIFSTLFGHGGNASPGPIALDSTGDIYLAGGTTTSSDFPATPGVFQPGPIKAPYDEGLGIGYVAKFNPSASALIYASEYGAGTTVIQAVALDSVGDLYLTGTTDEYEGVFPITPGAYSDQGTTFVAKVNPTATRLVYSTRIPGTEQAYAMAIDPAGNAYITGVAPYSDLPATPGAYQTNCGYIGYCDDAFVIKLNASGTGLVYATYLGGTGPQDPYSGEPVFGTGGNGIAADAQGNAYVAGSTSYSGFKTTPVSFQRVFGGAYDGFLVELNPAGSGLLYSTFLGGSSFDYADGITLDPSGNAYVWGQTESSADFPTTPGAYLRTPTKPKDFIGFVSKFNFSVPFCSLAASALIIAPANAFEDGYTLEAKFSLGGADKIDLLTEQVKIGVGPYSVTIPPGSFKLTPQGYTYQGSINGVTTTFVLRPAGPGDAPALAAPPSRCTSPVYFLAAGGIGTQPGSVTNPVPISISIGSDSGNVKLTATIER